MLDSPRETLSVGGGRTPSGFTANLDWNDKNTRVNVRWKAHDAPELRVVSGRIPSSMSANSGDVKERGINAIESDTYGWPQFGLGNFDLGPGGLPGVYLDNKFGAKATELKIKPHEYLKLTVAFRLANLRGLDNPYYLLQLQDTKGLRGGALEMGANIYGGASVRGRVDIREGQRPLISILGSVKF